MCKFKLQTLLPTIASLCWIIGAANAGEMFKSPQFLQLPADGQASYISTSVGMAGLIAARNDKKHSDCIDRWYFPDREKGNRTITDTMRQYPDYHPQAVVLAVLQKACGPFEYSKP
jgi:hypothetical protein